MHEEAVMRRDAGGDLRRSMPQQAWLPCEFRTRGKQGHCIVMPWVPIYKLQMPDSD